MKRILKLITFVVFLSLVLQVKAQDDKLAKVIPIKYNDNVKSPLNNEELSKIKEVYGDYTNQYVLSNLNKLNVIKNILRNRVKIYIEDKKDISLLQSLSEVPLSEGFNDALLRNVEFDVKTFNPLKYDFNYNSRDKTKRYKVDNTNYVIVVYSQYQRY